MIAHSKPWLSEEDNIAVQEVLHSGQISEGHMVAAFEHTFSHYLDLFGGVATSSGTTALVLALKAVDIEKGDVLIPSYVCRNVYDAVRWAGGYPILYDIDKDWAPTAESIQLRITSNTKAIILVHTFGISADSESICKLGYPVIEDCCQAIGFQLNGRTVGAKGKYCVVSFHATKLMTTGEGGMVLTSEQGAFERIAEIKYGDTLNRYVRLNFPMTDLQAALGLSQLKKYDIFLSRRAAIAEYYYDALAPWPEALPISIKDKSIFFRFPLRIKKLDFERVKIWYLERGIHVRRGVDAVLHRQIGLADQEYSNSTLHFEETLSIPIYPALQDSQVEYIVQKTKEMMNQYAY